jgi:signal transduction histidine kinase
MKKAVFAVWLLSIGALLHAQNIVWQKGKRSVAIGQAVFLLEDKGGTLDIAQVGAPPFAQQFTRSKHHIIHFGFSQSVHWLRFTLDNNSGENLVLEVAQAFLPYTDLYYRDVSKSWHLFKAGYTVNLEQKTIKQHSQVFPLPHGRNEFYIRLISYSHPLPVRIWNRDAFEVHANRQKLFFGIYAGILLFVIGVNVFLYGLFKKLYYLHYALLVFLYLATSAAVMDGYVLYAFPKLDLMFWYTTIPALNMPVLVWYCLSFLEVRKHSHKWYRISFAVWIYFTTYIFWKTLLPLTTVLLVNQIHAFSVFMVVTWLGLVTGKKGNKLGYYFAAAYAIWFILVGVEAVYIRFGAPPYFFEVSHVSLAIFIEVFLLAYLLLKRFEWERKAEQQARLKVEQDLLQIQQKFQQEILQAKLEIQENTLNHISREIHDNVGQVLSLAKVQVSLMEYAQAFDKNNLEQLKENLVKALSDLRDIAKGLSGERMQQIGLVASLEQEIQRINKSAVLEACLLVSGTTLKLSEQKQLLIFRIAQEAFQNILKHAEAKKMDVLLTFHPHQAELCIEDDGKGFDVAAASTGLGLLNIKSRAALIGGDAWITSTSDKGTRVELIVPYDKNQ